MFGYIHPDRPYLFIKDEKLYNAAYCGMCRSIGKACGNTPKSALTYDVAFMSCLLHNIAHCDMKIEKRRCVFHIFKRRHMTAPDEMSLMLACVNTALAYFKLIDDKQDGDFKGAFAFVYKKGYKRTLRKHPRIARIISESMQKQREIEARKSSIIEEACEPSAEMMKAVSDYVLGEYATEHTGGLMYDIGKWIYLADALDDYDGDVAKGRYNVLYNAFGYATKAEAAEHCGEELEFIFNTLFADMRNHLKEIKFYFNHDLTDNIILRGIPAKTRSLVYGKCGCGKKQEQQNDCPRGELYGGINNTQAMAKKENNE